ncbi:acyltransferase 3 [Cladochytrium replicatum]|nr:acyltransferase 3 [Cladochytrium replicatum]
MISNEYDALLSSDRLHAASPRTFFIDNLRTFLTLAVILLHTISTLAAGWFPLPPYPSSDPVFVLFYLCYGGANQGYFMSLFFFLAGLFVLRSLERKGVGAFLIDRALRLLLPIIFVYCLISPLAYYLCVIAGRVPNVPANTPSTKIWGHYFTEFRMDHTWFLYNLFIFSLLFAVIYGCTTLIRARIGSSLSESAPLTNISAFLILFQSFAVLFPAVFAIRVAFPIGVWIPALGQIAYLFAYVLFFSAGIWFQHRKIVDRFPLNAYSWLLPIMVAAFLALFSYRVYMAMQGTYVPTLGGATWQALVDTILEMFYMVMTSAFFVTVFRRFANNRPSALWKRINEASYTVYLIQQIVILPATLIVFYIPVHPLVMWIISSLMSVPVVWLLAMAIKSIPQIDRIL